MPGQAANALGNSREVDETICDICVQELNVDMVANVKPFEPPDDFSFRRWAGNPHPCSLVRSARYNPVEPLADAVSQEKRGGGFLYPALDFFGAVLLRSAVGCQFAQLRVGVGHGAIGHRRLQ